MSGVEESPIHFTTEKTEIVFAGHGKGLWKGDLREAKPIECQTLPLTLQSGVRTFSQRTLMHFRRESKRRRKCSTRSRWHLGIVKVKRIWRNLSMSDELVYEEESFALRDAVFIEIKSVEKIHSKHEDLLVNYLRMTGFGLGLQMGFSAYSKVGIRRRVV